MMNRLGLYSVGDNEVIEETRDRPIQETEDKLLMLAMN